MGFTKLTASCLGTALSIWLACPNRASAQADSTPPTYASNQPSHQVQLAVPFGVVDGQLVVSGRNLMFIDQQHPNGSFTVPRDDVRNLNTQAGQLTIDLVRPVQDSAGPASRLVFRLNDPAGAQDFTQWFHETQASASERTGRADRNAAPNTPEVTMSFQVRHDHRIGSDTGRLLVTPTQVIYESVTDVDSSRQWNLSDIKEVKRDGPYKLKVVPFSGNEYNFDLLGQGMSSDQYQQLVDEVTRARISRH